MKIAVLSGRAVQEDARFSQFAAVRAFDLHRLCLKAERSSFFKPAIAREELNTVKIHKSMAMRRLPGMCSFLRYNALAYVNNRLIIFDDVCHSCGAVFSSAESALSKAIRRSGN